LLQVLFKLSVSLTYYLTFSKFVWNTYKKESKTKLPLTVSSKGHHFDNKTSLEVSLQRIYAVRYVFTGKIHIKMLKMCQKTWSVKSKIGLLCLLLIVSLYYCIFHLNYYLFGNWTNLNLEITQQTSKSTKNHHKYIFDDTSSYSIDSSIEVSLNSSLN